MSLSDLCWQFVSYAKWNADCIWSKCALHISNPFSHIQLSSYSINIIVSIERSDIVHFLHLQSSEFSSSLRNITCEKWITTQFWKLLFLHSKGNDLMALYHKDWMRWTLTAIKSDVVMELKQKKKPVVLPLRYRAAPVEIHLTIKNKIKLWLNCFNSCKQY